MLYIYTGKAPKGMITDVEGVFKIFEDRDMKDPVALKLIKEIDSAKYYSDSNVKTPFGLANIYQLSSGCKAALLAIWSGVVVNFTEAGDNVYEALLKYAKDRDVKIWTNNRLMLNSKEIVCMDGKMMTANDCANKLLMKSIEERNKRNKKLGII